MNFIFTFAYSKTIIMEDWKELLSQLNVPAAPEEQSQESVVPKTKKLPRLKLLLDKRKGKTATIILGMENESEEDVQTLAKTLKTRLAVGGSARDGEILLQGDCRDKAKSLLLSLGYKL